jgi:hypothetical protein
MQLLRQVHAGPTGLHHVHDSTLELSKNEGLAPDAAQRIAKFLSN